MLVHFPFDRIISSIIEKSIESCYVVTALFHVLFQSIIASFHLFCGERLGWKILRLLVSLLDYQMYWKEKRRPWIYCRAVGIFVCGIVKDSVLFFCSSALTQQWEVKTLRTTGLFETTSCSMRCLLATTLQYVYLISTNWFDASGNSVDFLKSACLSLWF